MLTPEQITTDLIGTPESHPFRHLMVEVVRKVMAEVRKDDEALIRQMLEALEAGLKEVIATGENEGVLFGPDKHVDAKLQAAITAARARLEKAP